MPKDKANLIFDKGPMSGFAILAEQASVHPVTIVRELVQNSLDAAEEAKRDQAIVRFELAKHKSKDIPAFDTYKNSFRKVLNTSSYNQQDSAQSVIHAISEQIKSSTTEVLFVMDNGIGLNDKRMMALLSEAINVKQSSAAGSYGYGHTTVIPSSDLRYILYGGVCKKKRIAAGHAILASFKDGEEVKGKDGYFVVQKKEDMIDPFVYPQDEEVPDIIDDKLKIIEKEWGSGSAIIIPGFNHFNQVESASAEEVLWKGIKKAVACNFFVAVQEGKLKIEYKVGDRIWELDKNSISGVLEEYNEETRSKHFLNGRKAHQAYNTLLLGKDHNVPTSLGDIRIRVYQRSNLGQSEINLCRNGMHITDSVPHLGRYDFTSYIPFHCLILVDASNGDFHRFIRKAEPPKHDEIKMMMLEPKERAKLRNSLNEIKDYLRQNLKELEAEEFAIRDVLNLKSHGVNAIATSPPRTRIGTRGGGGGSEGGGGSGRGNGSGSGGSAFKREGKSVEFRATPVQTGKRSYNFQVALEESKYDSEIRFALDEYLDLTCENRNVEDFVYLSNVKIDGKSATSNDLIRSDSGKILGINLGSGKRNQVKLAFDFILPDDSGIDKNAPVSLQAELVRRRTDKGKK